MKGKILALSVIAVLLLGLMAVSVVQAKPEKPKVLVFVKGAEEVPPELQDAMKELDFVEWIFCSGNLRDKLTPDVDMVIMIQATEAYSDDDVSAVVEWFNQGGKTLWVTGDSDYGSDAARIPPANKVLEAVGSSLRIAHGAVEDPESNAGKPYRVIAFYKAWEDPKGKIINPKIDGAKVLFHGPSFVYTVVTGSPEAIEPGKFMEIAPIVFTTDKATIADHNPPSVELFGAGYTGRMVLMALEFMPEKDNVVIASGEAPFDHYQGMYTDEYKGYELDGKTFVKAVIEWGSRYYYKVHGVPLAIKAIALPRPNLTLGYITLILGIIVAALGYIFLLGVTPARLKGGK